MIVKYNVSPAGNVKRREFTRETTNRYYYLGSWTGKETWESKNASYSGTFHDSFEEAKKQAIMVREKRVHDLARQHAHALDALALTHAMTEEDVLK